MTQLLTPKILALPEQLIPGEIAIIARDISLSYGDKRILDSVDITVTAGEILALVGPNGAGKSTLLDVLSGDAHASGTLDIVGKPIGDWKVADLARQRAVLTQQNMLSFPFTVFEVVEMGRAPWQRTPREDDDDEAIREALSITDTAQFIERRYPSLSGGEKARASLARVLAQRTGIIFLDEPTAALDIKHQEAVLQVAKQRAQNGDAVVVVLHDLNLAAAYADRVTLLNHGRVYADGSPSEVLTAEAISTVYQYPVEIIAHPKSGLPLVLPLRDADYGPQVIRNTQ